MNPWLDNEIKQIEFEHLNSKRKLSMIKIIVMIACAIFLAVTYTYGDVIDTSCPNCKENITIEIETRAYDSGTWSKNWTCQCGYENYGEINNCGVCGRPKPKK